MALPTIIQGGMGVGVSSSGLAREVAAAGHLGVVSGTALAVVLARNLALGDPDGRIRRVLDRFPYPEVADRVYRRHVDSAEGGGAQRFRSIPMPTLTPPAALTELTVVANFVEVALAKEGHDGVVGINYLEKIQLPTLASLYGAMLADVDYVLVGAGVPARFPALLDRLREHLPVAMPVTVAGAQAGERHEITFDPDRIAGDTPKPTLRRPRFLAIVSSSTMATFLARNATGSPDGFVVESPVAGGHNAPPRGQLRVDDAGQPIYGPRDAIDLDAVVSLGLPFWLAGGYATAAGLRAARAAGAVGVQVGTAFAFCDESGVDEPLRRTAVAAAAGGGAAVTTSAVASPTGYPFKVLDLPGTLSEPAVYEHRPRRCDLGYLREPYRREDGRVGYRCAAEPVEEYAAKGGDPEDARGRVCLCNALLVTNGLGQVRADGYVEPPVLTAGDDVARLRRYLPEGAARYHARDVLDVIEDAGS